ncbi:hypothetical protein AHF37_10654 [Paragonimus kellicotti]|nr:hypothetical protein AHF37_10654 [Paragonimus kellicotti]
MREKKLTSWKEAKQEAEMRGLLPVTPGLDAEADTSNAKILMSAISSTNHQTGFSSGAESPQSTSSPSVLQGSTVSFVILLKHR